MTVRLAHSPRSASASGLPTERSLGRRLPAELLDSAACQPKLTRIHVSEGWSGRRGSNPRPTAWKAVTLPLSYSRLRARHRRFLALGEASPPLVRFVRRSARALANPACSLAAHSVTASVGLPQPMLATDRLAQPKLAMRAKAGGEGRIRTSEAARATDLQSAAFDRSATSPALVERRRAAADTFLRPRRSDVQLFVENGCLGAYLQNPEPAQTGAGGGI